MAQIYQNPITIDKDTRIHQPGSIGEFCGDYQRMYSTAGCEYGFGQTILIDLLA
jgi:hypothetical protein